MKNGRLKRRDGNWMNKRVEIENERIKEQIENERIKEQSWRMEGKKRRYREWKDKRVEIQNGRLKEGDGE